MKKPLILIASIFLFLTSCSESKPAKFERDGVSITSPTGWGITDEENIDDLGYYLSVEKDGFDSSGIITITWVNGEMDLNEWVDIYKEELENNIIYKNSKLNFKSVAEGSFNDINSTSLKFTASILGLDHEGDIHFFYKGDKTFAILIQQATEDNATNKPGFDLIEKSFSVE
ncbi:hypothetical protein QSV08_20675 [Maribacter sp. BPC-D8]|uniref:hypothetical protein n=1 Tax=Maribacter sp. BPC-D8 TaxID=3053613 RepID=UPI002B45CDA8|nr:hypothetical protein [Maribacter sp. BPC-D8]WRI29614.1 hypothetical protein QSV08_20675 [Maribacter sp. BPC-D8]